jgi:O-antigen/teichoic acid export membrane protein
MILIWGIGSMILSYTFFYFFFKLRNVEIPFSPYFIFSMATVFVNNFITLQQIEYRLTKKANKFFFLTMSIRLVTIIISVIFVILLKWGAAGKMGAIAVSSLIFSIYSFMKMYKGNGIQWPVFLSAIKFCWPLALSALLWYFLGGVDRVFLERLNDTQTLGIYNVAAGLTAKFAVFYTAMSKTFEPDILKSIIQKKYKKMIMISLLLISLSSIPNLLFIIFAKPIVSLLTAGRYTAAIPFARIIILKNISMSLYYTIISIIVGFGFTKSELMNRIVGASICFFLFKYLIGRYGFYGAAWGQSISFLIMTIIGVGFVYFNRLRFKGGKS